MSSPGELAPDTFPALRASRRVRGAIILVLALAACGESPTQPGAPRPSVPPRQLDATERALVAANADFGLELLRHVAAEVPGNVLISPLSVSMALGMTLNGTSGGTWQEMRATLGFGELSADRINEGYRGLIDQLRARDPAVELGIANSVWHDRSFVLLPQFVETAATYFDAHAAALDFASPEAPGTINGWVSRATGGRIPRLIESISPDEVAFLVNAVYFKASWSTRFDPRATRIGTFTRADGSTVPAAFMSRSGALAHAWTGEALAVELPYRDSAFSMLAILPHQGSVDEFARTLTAERWDALVGALVTAEAQLQLPRFTFRMERDLGEALAAMGMPSAFDPATADFSALTPEPEGLYISRVQHDTFIKVDEEGTEAAAATAVGIGRVSLPPQLTFDRPFLAAIRERDTGTILFIGIVRDPAA